MRWQSPQSRSQAGLHEPCRRVLESEKVPQLVSNNREEIHASFGWTARARNQLVAIRPELLAIGWSLVNEPPESRSIGIYADGVVNRLRDCPPRQLLNFNS